MFSPLNAKTRMLLFTLLAPITVPGYVLFLAVSNLLGAAFYIVFEATILRIAKRPISLTRRQMIVLALPVLLASPLAATGHFLIAAIRGVGRALCAVGHWQTGIISKAPAFAIGTVWVLAAVWCSLVCFNAAMAMGWIGQGIDEDARFSFVDAVRRGKVMGELPPAMQSNRKRIIDELRTRQGAINDHWKEYSDALERDTFSFSTLMDWDYTLPRKLGGIPWYFIPKELAEDGLDHSQLLLGPLLFVWLVLIRWPGTFKVFRGTIPGLVWYVVRVIVVVATIHGMASWVPSAIEMPLFTPGFKPEGTLGLLSPATWFGAEFERFAQYEWYVYNVGLWLAILGAVTAIWWTAWRVSPFVGWPRYYVAFLASRLLQRKRIAFFSVLAVTLCVAMMIIVISVMGGFVDSIRNRADGLLGDLVMDGSLQGFPFYEEFIDEVKKLQDPKTKEPIVEEATPLIYSYGILQFPANQFTKAVQIWGVKLDEYVKVNDFGKDLFYNNRYGDTSLSREAPQPKWKVDAQGRVVLPDHLGEYYRTVYLPKLSEAERKEEERRYPQDAKRFMGPGVFAPAYAFEEDDAASNRPYPGLIVGRDLIFRRRSSGEYGRSSDFPRGELCLLTVLPMSRTAKIIQQSPPQPAFRYVDDSKTGIHEIDSKNVYVDFDRLQSLLKMGPQEREAGGMTSARCNQIQIKLKQKYAWPRDVLMEQKRRVWEKWRAVTEKLDKDEVETHMINGVDISTWEEMQASFIAAIEKEKFLVLIMFGVISIVAVLLILCIFFMIVQEKTRDIGIIKSVGASTEGIAAVFLVYGAAIGLVGAILGALLGTTFVEHINDVQEWLARINPEWRVWSPETYSFDEIPHVWKWGEVIGIGILAMVSAVLGAAIPAIRAGRTWPVEALRYE